MTTPDSIPDLPSQLSPVSQKRAWEDRYLVKGRQWGNAPSEFPLTPDTGVILELGIGDGKNLRTRTCPGTLCIGLDFSLAALNLCKRDKTLAGIHLIQADACQLPVRDSSVNQVYAHHILGHLPAFLQVILINEIFRVLKPTGSLALTVFASGDMRDGQGSEVEPGTFLRGDGIITRYFTPEEMQTLGEGFIIRSLMKEEWPLRIRGNEHLRAILTAVLEKPDLTQS